MESIKTAIEIIATVVADPDIWSVLVLGVIVLIRTLLSVSLQVELEGRFPWQAEAVPPDSRQTAS